MRPTEWYIKDTDISIGSWRRLAEGHQEFVVANNSDYSCVCRCICDGRVLGYLTLGKRFTVKADDTRTVYMVLLALLGSGDDHDDICGFIHQASGDSGREAVVYHVRHVAETFEQLIAMDDGEGEW